MEGDVRETVYGDFAADFAEDRLAGLCDPSAGIQTGPFGSQLHQEDYVAVGTPIITVEHLGENYILHKNVPRVSDTDRNRLSKYVLRAGDIVFSRVGSVDRRALVRSAEHGWLFSGRCLRVRPDVNRIDARFLSYFLGLTAFKEHIRAIAVGATMPSLNTSILSGITVVHPRDIGEQRAIAHILGTLDDKIELNHRMNETLEATARALFKSWFVDFDPVHAKAEGRHTGLPKDIADLFPDEFEDSELGRIPKGWKVEKVSTVAECIKGKSYASEDLQDSSTALVTLKSFSRGGGYRHGGLKPYVGEFKPEQVVQAGGLVVACTDVTQAAEVVGKPAIIPWHDQFDRLVASLDVLIVRPRSESVSVPFLYCTFRTERFSDHTYAQSTGTTVLHLSAHAIPSYDFVLPQRRLLAEFDSLAQRIFERIDMADCESRTLAAIRDTLLPKLISGQLRVKDAEKLAAEVA